MPADEFVRWCAFLNMKNLGGDGSPTSPRGGKIGRFKNRLSKMGYYKATSRR